MGISLSLISSLVDIANIRFKICEKSMIPPKCQIGGKDFSTLAILAKLHRTFPSSLPVYSTTALAFKSPALIQE